MKGNETKGGETAMILATMDEGSRGFKRKGRIPKKTRKKKKKREVPWVLWKGALAIGAGTAAAMAIVASAFS